MPQADQKQLLLRVDASVELARRNLSSLEKQVASDAAKMDVSLGRLESRAEKLGQSIGNGTRNLLSVGDGQIKALFAGAIGGGLLAATKGALDYADAIADLADRTGASTKIIQEFRYAAQLSGSSVENADAAIEKFAKTLGLAQSGAKQQAELLRSLGVTSADYDVAIRQTIDGVSKLDTTQKQNVATLAVFGKSAADLTGLLAQGAGAFDELAAAAAKLGIVLDEDVIRNAGQVNDKLDSMKMIVTAEFASAIAQNADSILALVNAVASLATALPAANQQLAGLSRILKNEGLIGYLTSGRARLSQASTPAGYFNLKKAEVDAATADLNQAISGGGSKPAIDQRARILRNKVAELRDAQAQLLATKVVTSGKPADAGAGQLPGYSAPKKTGPAKKAELDLGPDLRNLDPRAGFGFDGLPALGDTDTSDYLRAVQEGIDRQRDAEADLYRMGEDRVRDLAGFLEESLTGRAGSFWGNFKQIGFSVIAQIGARLLTGNGGAGGGFGAIVKSAGSSVLGGLFGGAFAAGGDPPLGKVSLVGERGPELFVPKVPGTIIPNHALGGGGAPRSLSLSMTVNGVSNRAEMEAIGVRAAQAAYQQAVATSGRSFAQLSRPSLPGSLG